MSIFIFRHEFNASSRIFYGKIIYWIFKKFIQYSRIEANDV